MWMNEHEIDQLEVFFPGDAFPNLGRGVQVLTNLRDWTNANSDGWCYWNKPSKAADRLMEHFEAQKVLYFRGGNVTDLTDAELRKLLTPIKAFLTRQGVDHSEVL